MSRFQSDDLDNLLYSGSQYGEEDDLQKELNSVQEKFMGRKDLESEDEDEEEQGVDMGNGESVEGDREWDENEEGSAWNRQQQAQYFFRDVAGNSQQFSQSMSMHKADLQSKSMHDNSMNIENINLQNILNHKKKEEEQVNEVVQRQFEELARAIKKKDEEINKLQCFVSSYLSKIRNLQGSLEEVKKQNYELEENNRRYLEGLKKKDQLFKSLKMNYQIAVEKLSDEQSLNENLKKQIQRLKGSLSVFTESDRGLTDFRNLTPRRAKEGFRSTTPSRERELDRQLEKIKREKMKFETEYQIAKQQVLRKDEKLSIVEEDMNRKVSMKEKRIKELQQSYETKIEDLNKNKKTSESLLNDCKKKIQKMEKDSHEREEKIKQLEHKIKYSVEEIKKKEEKIKDLLTEIGDKNKKIAELKGALEQEEARNQIQSKLQKERESQIDKLELQVKDLKSSKFNLQREIQNFEKPSNLQQKLKREIEQFKRENDKIKKDNKEMREQLNNLQKQVREKDEKIREFKKKNEDLIKKIQLTNKNKNVDSTELLEFKDIISKLTTENIELKKKAEKNQQMANKLYILESRIQTQSQEEHEEHEENEEFGLEEQIEELREELELKDREINNLKEAHLREIKRMTNENELLAQNIQENQSELEYKEKELEFIHMKFVGLEKENAELKASKNILHSSFYDESFEHGDSQTVYFYENKIGHLEKRVQSLSATIREKDSQLQRQKQNSSSRFEINQLRSRIRELQAMVISNEPNRKISPESLSQEETIQFLLKTLKRVIKSTEMIRSLSKNQDFRTIIFSLERILKSK